MRVAVVDLGKTNAKVAWVDTVTATEQTLTTIPSPVRDAEPYPHLDTQAIEAFIVAALAEGGPVDAITVTTHGATAALIDAQGELALPVLDYEHVGPDELSAAYDAARPNFASTGSPRLPGGLNIGAQLFWQQHRFAARFARATALLTWPQFWVHRLCGVRANDLSSLGAHTDLHDPRTGESSSLVDGQGWSALMPATCRSGERLGTLRAELAARTGLSEQTSVHAGIHDSNASLVPHLLTLSAPFTVVSTGTWVIVMAVDGDAVELDESRDTLINIDAFGRPVPSARFMGGREHAMLTDRNGAAAMRDSVPASAELLERLIEDRAWLLPATVPGTGPFPDDAAIWTLERERLQARFGEDAVETVIAGYLAAVTLTSMTLAGAAGDSVVEGPFARNDDFLHALAAGSGRPVLRSASATGTSVGAAMLIERPAIAPATRALPVDPTLQAAWRRYLTGWQHAVDERTSRAAQAR